MLMYIHDICHGDKKQIRQSFVIFKDEAEDEMLQMLNEIATATNFLRQIDIFAAHKPRLHSCDS